MTAPLIVLITGSAHGLGREVARQLHELGHTAIVSARSAAAAVATAGELGCSAVEVDLDIVREDQVNAAISEVSARFGRLDVLINNAAAYVDWSETGSRADLTAARAVFETNLFGSWAMIQAALPLLTRSSPSPRIVNVTSGAGSHGDPAFGLAVRGGAAASYGISKAALGALTATLAAEFADTKLLINAVCPDLTATWPGAEESGARPVRESAQGVVWAATLPDDGPTGGFFRDADPLPW